MKAHATVRVRCRGTWFLHVMIWLTARILQVAACCAGWCFRLGLSFVLVEVNGRPWGRFPAGEVVRVSVNVRVWERRIHELVRSAGEWDAISEAGR